MTYVDSERHKLEVQHYRYRTYMKELLSKFGLPAKERFPEALIGKRAELGAEHRALRLAS